MELDADDLSRANDDESETDDFSEVDETHADTDGGSCGSQQDTVTTSTLIVSSSSASNKQVPIVEKKKSQYQIGACLEFMVKQWTSTSPSIHTVYIFFGHDFGLNIMGSMGGMIGQRFRLMKCSTGEWDSVSFRHWKPGHSAPSPSTVLVEDMDFFG